MPGHTRFCKNWIDRRDFDALIFDLDGVVTSTAELHAQAWKRLFDEFLVSYADTALTDRSPFRLPKDYLNYVDGKPRVNGIRDFLKSRGIEIAQGCEGDLPSDVTLHGLGARKNGYYHELLQRHGVRVFDSSVDFIRKARRLGFKTAVASSSKNCTQVLQIAGLKQLFDAQFDGNDLAQQGIVGKPDPGMFLAAVRLLNTDAKRAVVFEDAISGVEAGKRGGFGLVVGVDRAARGASLARHGADIVVQDLAELEPIADDH